MNVTDSQETLFKIVTVSVDLLQPNLLVSRWPFSQKYPNILYIPKSNITILHIVTLIEFDFVNSILT